MGILGANTHVNVVVRVGFGEETHEDNLLLESVENGCDVVEVEGSAGQVRSARDDDLRLALAAQDVGQGRADRGDGTDQLRPGRGRGLVNAGLRGRRGRTVAVVTQVFTHLTQLPIVEGRVEGEAALPNLAVRGDDDDKDATGSQSDDLKVLEDAHARPRILHKGHLMRHLSEETNGTLHDVVDIDGLGQEGLEGVAFRPTHRLELRESIDEHAVAAVGRHTPRRGVGLIDQAGFLQHSHVVADGRG
ncbi:Uncharacterised protein [Mycobacteroides abscessus subsp. abscessus]|nr:Uncharacterised protein [Mycobacteroides abscessus subsp. abscessus]